MRFFCLALASALGLGYIPWASGTFGTLWGPLIFYAMRDLPFLTSLGIVLMATGLAIYISHEAERYLPSHDSSVIVIDEVVGYLFSIVGLGFSVKTAVLAFLLFRLFDILKPYPIRQVDQKCPGGMGVVLDDVLAGILANLTLRLLFYLGV